MKKNRKPLSLQNQNGLSHDDTRSCSLDDMNCRKGQRDARISLQDLNAAAKKPRRVYSLTDMNAYHAPDEHEEQA